jgi:isopentenyl-diphosphate delta-isomerase type 1
MNADVKAGQNLNELFDVVNERDEVVGQAPRHQVHAQELLHRAVHVMVFNGKGQLFLQKRSMAKDSEPGTWSASCSGHVDAGESYDRAAQRELEEEIGLRLETPPMRWLRFRACEALGNEFVWIYRVEHEGPFVLNEAEVAGGAWFEPAAITRGIAEQPNDFAGSFRFLWGRVAMEL